MGNCSRCGRQWKGLSAAHCTGCCEHFKSVYAFDKHRDRRDDIRRCLSIEEMFARKMYFNEVTKAWSGEKMPDGFRRPEKQPLFAVASKK